MRDSEGKSHIVLDIVCMLLMAVSGIIVVVSTITKHYYSTTFESIIYTITSPLQGFNIYSLRGFWLYVAGFSAVILCSIALYVVKRRCSKQVGRNESVLKKRAFRVGFYCITAMCALFAVVYVSVVWNLPQFLQRYNSTTEIYEQYCVLPNAENVHGENTNNLIFIYLESMERQYAFDDGTECGCIPRLTEIAQKNVSFGKTDQYAGGTMRTRGATWTLGSMLATMSGLPYALPVGNNAMDLYDYFMPKLVNLGDILQAHGYVQEFLLGSEIEFAGTDKFFTQHGGYRIFDYNTAVEKGYTDKHENWGFVDSLLYRIAKDELTELAGTGKPFNLTIATLDTHFPDGYICNLCPTTYGNITANVISCADTQLSQFFAWLKEQPFFENTTIVIVGDHLRMDTAMVKSVEDRRVYNCFINSRVQPKQQEAGRIVGSFDIFPSTLAAMGFEIEGNRLGIGTNLFSEQQTLFEELGYDYVDNELSKHSLYYLDLCY